MKALLRLTGLAAALHLLPAAYAADLNGTWKGAFEFQGNSMPTTLNLKTADTGVTGTVEGLPTSPAPIHEGKVEGDTITFWVNTDYQGQVYKLLYKGKVTENQIEFSFGTDDGSWGTTVTVKKADAESAPAAADVSGAWKGSWDFNGNTMPVTINLTRSGESVTGTIEGMGAAPIEIHDGKVDGDSVTFWINTDYQGQTYALTYKGKVSSGQIEFQFGTADGAWGSNVTVKKS